MRNRLLLGCVFTAVISIAALGQITTSSYSSGPKGVSAQFTMSPPRFLPAAVTGAPYTADQVSEHIQTLADGTHISQNRHTERIYRDSAGRTRTERQMFGGMTPSAEVSEIPPVVEIIDPTAGVEYVLDQQNHIAHCFTLQQAPRVARDTPGIGTSGGTTTVTRAPSNPGTGTAVAGGPPAGTSRPRVQQTQNEPLGTQVMEGVVVEGTRWTTVYEAGSVGNDRPITATHETWRSQQLKVVVLTKTEDPRSGESVTRLTNISLSEPDAALFQPPADYKIVNDTEAVTITYKRP